MVLRGLDRLARDFRTPGVAGVGGTRCMPVRRSAEMFRHGIGRRHGFRIDVHDMGSVAEIRRANPGREARRQARCSTGLETGSIGRCRLLTQPFQRTLKRSAGRHAERRRGQWCALCCTLRCALGCALSCTLRRSMSHRRAVSCRGAMPRHCAWCRRMRRVARADSLARRRRFAVAPILRRRRAIRALVDHRGGRAEPRCKRIGQRRVTHRRIVCAAMRRVDLRRDACDAACEATLVPACPACGVA